MKYFSKLLLAFALCISAIPNTFAADADPLFVNLTSDDPHRANMAISFGGNQHERGHPLTIFLNDKAVLVGAKSNAERFSEHQARLSELIDNGATVLICPMCMKHYGVEEGDLLTGIKVGNPGLTGAALFSDDTKTLTW